MDWDAFIKDVTVAPSKQEGQGIDFFFGMLNRRNESVQKDKEVPKKDHGVLGDMLDRSSDSKPASAAHSVASQTVLTTKSDRSRTDKRFFMMQHDEHSAVSDTTPNPSQNARSSWKRSETSSCQLAGHPQSW